MKLASCLVIGLMLCGCTNEVDLARDPAGGAGGVASGGNGGQAAGGSGGNGAASGGGGGSATSNECDQSNPCGGNQWCDYPDGQCSGAGVCKDKPGGCFADCPGVCGCDGGAYCNACDAQVIGVDVVEGDTTCLQPTCEEAQNSLRELLKVNGKLGHCTLAIRLTENDQPIGYQVFCENIPAILSLSQAAELAFNETGYGQVGTHISGDSPSDFFVFREMPDIATPNVVGGVAVVSKVAARVVFGGVQDWTASGPGDYIVPDAWRPAAELGLGCPTTAPQNFPEWPTRGYDLGTGATLVGPDLWHRLTPLYDTVIPDVVDPQGSGSPSEGINAMVLSYQRGQLEQERVVLINVAPAVITL